MERKEGKKEEFGRTSNPDFIKVSRRKGEGEEAGEDSVIGGEKGRRGVRALWTGT